VGFIAPGRVSGLGKNPKCVVGAEYLEFKASRLVEEKHIGGREFLSGGFVLILVVGCKVWEISSLLDILLGKVEA